jgi:flagellar hook-length control protein FliK
VAAVAQPEAAPTQTVDGDVITSDTDIETVTALDDAVATVVDEPVVVAAPIIAAQLTRTVNTADKPVQPQPTAATQKTAQPAAMTQVAASQQRAVVTDSKPQMQAKSDVATSDTPEFEIEQSVMPLRRRFVTATTETAKVEPTKTVEITPQVSTAPVQTVAANAAAHPVVDVPADTPTDTQSAEGTPSLDTNDAAWVETLSAQIEANFTDTGGEIELQLTPENLGQLRIRLEVVDGAAQVTIVTESTDAARLFQQNEAKLSELLAKSGLNLTDHNASAERQDRRDGQPNGQGIANANGRSGSQDGETTQINMTSADNGLVNLIA